MNTEFKYALNILAIVIAISINLSACVGGNSKIETVHYDGISKLRMISVENASVAEGNNDISNLTFTIRLSIPSSRNVLVHYETSDISARGGSDYKPTIGNVTVFAGDTTALVNVAVIGDTDGEVDETLKLTISEPVGVIIKNASAIGTIINDDKVPVSCEECPSNVKGIIGEAYSFDGINDKVIYDQDLSVDWSNTVSFSLETWVSTVSCTANQAELGRYDAISGSEWWIGCREGRVIFKLVDSKGNGSDSHLYSNVRVDDGQWHHIYAERDGVNNVLRLYVDGILEAETDNVVYTGDFYSKAEISIGLVQGIPNVYAFEGIVDEVIVNNKTLSPKLIKQHFNDGVFGLHRGYVTCDNKKVRIMPLGDSITAGSGGKRIGGYRRSLDSLLRESGYRYDFVGSQSDAGVPFDPNYEGGSGYTISDIEKHINAWLTANSPDVILLHIGSNGVLDASRLGKVLGMIESFSSEITTVVARIINTKPPNSTISIFNDEVEKLVNFRAANGARLLFVDMEAALTPLDMKDNKHPNNVGYHKMAVEWFNGLSLFLPLCDNVASVNESTPMH